jgi:uncharacterized protein (DUF4213/DUF364 family)
MKVIGTATGDPTGNDAMEEAIMDYLLKHDREWCLARGAQAIADANKNMEDMIAFFDREAANKMAMVNELCTVYVTKREKNPRSVPSEEEFLTGEVCPRTGVAIESCRIAMKEAVDNLLNHHR